MELNEEAIRARLKVTPPACFASMKPLRDEPPAQWAGKNLTVWKLACPCGGDHGQFLGYPVGKFNPHYDGPEYLSPFAFRCAKCGTVHEVMDTNRHGYHAYICDSPSHITGEGEKSVYACAKCHGTDLAVKVCLFHWDDIIEMIEEEPEEFADKAENMFIEFHAFGHCQACGHEEKVAEYNKL
ncbi:MAG TPA: hypothetical protein VF472_04010 [Burkholderiaceae bacterium]